MRSKRSLAALANTIPRRDHENLTTPSENQPPSSVPPAADSNPPPRRVNTSKSRVSLVIRNTRRSRKTPLLTSIPRYNHYLLARSFVENDKSRKQSSSERDPGEHYNTTPSRLCNDVSSPDAIIPDFIWRFSPPYLDSQVLHTLSALRSLDPETFKELLIGPD